jgi:hypothetical protein
VLDVAGSTGATIAAMRGAGYPRDGVRPATKCGGCGHSRPLPLGCPTSVRRRGTVPPVPDPAAEAVRARAGERGARRCPVAALGRGRAPRDGGADEDRRRAPVAPRRRRGDRGRPAAARRSATALRRRDGRVRPGPRARGRVAGGDGHAQDAGRGSPRRAPARARRSGAPSLRSSSRSARTRCTRRGSLGTRTRRRRFASRPAKWRGATASGTASALVEGREWAPTGTSDAVPTAAEDARAAS